MGHAFAQIELSNPRNDALSSIKVSALADTGALMLCIPEHISLQLQSGFPIRSASGMTVLVAFYA